MLEGAAGCATLRRVNRRTFLTQVSKLGAALSLGAVTVLLSRRVRADDVEAHVTVFGATWCQPCKVLEAALRARKIPYEEIDVDQNPQAYAMAKKASGTNGIPLTLVQRGGKATWVLGADPDAVERAYRGE